CWSTGSQGPVRAATTDHRDQSGGQREQGGGEVRCRRSAAQVVWSVGVSLPVGRRSWLDPVASQARRLDFQEVRTPGWPTRAGSRTETGGIRRQPVALTRSHPSEALCLG